MSATGLSVLSPGVRRHRRGSGWRIVAGVIVVVLALLVVAQLLLPGIAADRLRTQLSRHGQVLSLSVSAFPAIELLWGHADSVSVTMASYTEAPASTVATSPATATGRTGLQRLADFLAKTAGTDTLHARAAWLTTGHLVLRNVVLTKLDGQLTATADVTANAVQAALPHPFTLRPVSSSSGQLLFRGGIRVLGAHPTVEARLKARHGELVVEPDVLGLFPSFVSLTVFSDPRIYVESVGSQRWGSGWAITAHARLTGD